VVLRKPAVWVLFLAAVYVARDFFFTAFMTFLFSYVALALVGWGTRRLAPGRDRPALRRLLTVAVIVLIPLILVGVGAWLAPRLLQQGKTPGRPPESGQSRNRGVAHPGGHRGPDQRHPEFPVPPPESRTGCRDLIGTCCRKE
jgi:hypothetical protein